MLLAIPYVNSAVQLRNSLLAYVSLPLRMHCFYRLFIFSLLATTTVACRTAAPVPQAYEGSIDLTHWNLSEQGNVDLHGEWEFYWNQLLPPESADSALTPATFVTLPSVWNGTVVNGQPISGLGYATYRQRVLLHSSQDLLALRVGNAATALSVYVNGQLVHQVGTVGCSAEETTPRYVHDYAVFQPAGDTLDITLHVANFHHHVGGAWSPITLGTERNIRRAWRNDIAADFFLMGSILIIALYHIILFFFRKTDRSPLHFSLFCLAIIIHMATVDNYVINFLGTLNWGWVIRLEYLSFYLGLPVFMSYFYHLFTEVVSIRWVRILWIIASFGALVVMILPPRLFTYTLGLYQFITVLTIVFIFYTARQAIVRRLPGSRSFTLGFAVIFFVFVYDVMVSNYVISPPFIFSWGLFTFIFFQTFLLSQRFSLAFNAEEEMNDALSFKNKVINERNEELKQLNNELDVFVYRTSHDLRAPISSVIGLINIMRAEKETSQFSTYLDLQEKSLLKLDNFIQDILNYSRNSRLQVTPEPVDFHQLLTDVFAMHSYLPNLTHIEKRTAIHQTEPFATDVKRLTIILNNLISNAIRYANLHQPHPYISTTVNVSASLAQITVEDNGIGIAAEHLDNVFDMFYRATSETKGSGLGLFIVKETVQKLKGTIQVRSQVREGTTFVLTVPNLRAVSS